MSSLTNSIYFTSKTPSRASQCIELFAIYSTAGTGMWYSVNALHSCTHGREIAEIVFSTEQAAVKWVRVVTASAAVKATVAAADTGAATPAAKEDTNT